MLGALPALGLLGTSMFDGGGFGAGLGLLGGMAGGLIGSNTPYPKFDYDQSAPWVGFNTFGQDFPVGAQGMLQGYLGQPAAGAPGSGFGYGGGTGGPNPVVYGGMGSAQGYGFGKNGASYLPSAPPPSGYPGGGWYDGRSSVTTGAPYGSLTQYQGLYNNSFAGSFGAGNGGYHLGGGSFNQTDPYGLNVAGNYFHQGATSAGISTGPDGFGAVGLFTGYDIGWGSLAAQQMPQPQQPSYGGYGGGGYGSGGYPSTGGGYGYVGAGASAGFGGGQGGYSGGQQGGYGGGYAPPTSYGFTPSGMLGGYQGGAYQGSGAFKPGAGGIFG